MKDKIVYLVIGLLIATILMLLVNNTNNLTADNHSQASFDEVLIRGILIIGEGENKIVLRSTREKNDIILKSKDSYVGITSKPNESTIVITADLMDNRDIGVVLSSNKENNPNSTIGLSDIEGKRVITTSRDVKSRNRQ